MEKKKAAEYPAGIKWTRQRKKVYDILKESVEPLSAAGIYQRLLKEETQESYAVSTIYRVLNAFEEKELVNRDVWPEDGTVFYELNRGGHTHYAVCLECHKRIPLQGCPISRMHLSAGTEDFTVTGHRIELYGYCKDCRQAGKVIRGENFS